MAMNQPLIFKPVKLSLQALEAQVSWIKDVLVVVKINYSGNCIALQLLWFYLKILKEVIYTSTTNTLQDNHESLQIYISKHC